MVVWDHSTLNKRCLVILLLLSLDNGVFDHFGYYERTRWPLTLYCSRHNEEHGTSLNPFLGICSLTKGTLLKVTNQVPGPRQCCWVSTCLHYNWKVMMYLRYYHMCLHLSVQSALAGQGWMNQKRNYQNFWEMQRNRKLMSKWLHNPFRFSNNNSIYPWQHHGCPAELLHGLREMLLHAGKTLSDGDIFPAWG